MLSIRKAVYLAASPSGSQLGDIVFNGDYPINAVEPANRGLQAIIQLQIRFGIKAEIRK